MFRLPVSSRLVSVNSHIRFNSSSSFIRDSFIEYFVGSHGHKHVKSSSVVPLCDPSVPFVNAGMNQFKGVFLGKVDPPHARVVNSQKCVRVGGKHNDLEVVGTDGTHHTFFEMLGNWSFGDYYKMEACQMAWDLLLGPYRLKPENLLVTYFKGDPIIDLIEDRECRDAWRAIGVPESRLQAREASDNFWEMGQTGPCGPCTEIHHINSDGTLTELWNLVFIHCYRDDEGKVRGLRTRHVDTGMGLERAAALLQGVNSNYDTDLFRPIISAIQQNAKDVNPYGGTYGPGSDLDAAYRRLADHARMISICLADGVYPGTSLNLKQIMRKSFKLSESFGCPRLLEELYTPVSLTLGDTYPELREKEVQAKRVIQHEQEAYRKLRSEIKKKWKDLAKQYPEVEELNNVELASFAQGYREFKQAMKKCPDNTIPGELVFKLYDTYGFSEDLVKRIAELNDAEVDVTSFWKLYTKHRTRHKTAIKEQTPTTEIKFQEAIKKLQDKGIARTNDLPKYNYKVENEEIVLEPLHTKIVGILSEDIEWIDYLEARENIPFILVTKDSNFFCEEGGQVADKGEILLERNNVLQVETVFKIRDFIFHKGQFKIDPENMSNYINNDMDVVLKLDKERRLNLMRNHTGVHLLNAAVRKVLSSSGVSQVGSGVSDNGLYLSLSVYGDKLTPKVVTEVEELVRQSIAADSVVRTRMLDSVQLPDEEGLVTVPGEAYPDVGLRLVETGGPLVSKELCCGTHVPSTRQLSALVVSRARGAGSSAPTLHAITGARAAQARELFCRAERLEQVIDLVDPERKEEEVSLIKTQLRELCAGSGAPAGDHAACLARLDSLQRSAPGGNEAALQAVAEEEIRSALSLSLSSGRRFCVHFVRASYLMRAAAVRAALAPAPAPAPALLLACANGILLAVSHVPQEMVSETFDATRWLNCIVGVFGAEVEPAPPGEDGRTFAQMTNTKVSLITCEQQVQDAMRVAIKFAQSHYKEDSPPAVESHSLKDDALETDSQDSKGRRQN